MFYLYVIPAWLLLLSFQVTLFYPFDFFSSHKFTGDGDQGKQHTQSNYYHTDDATQVL